MELLTEIKNYNDNMEVIPYGEVIKFAESIDNRVNEEVQKLENLIQEIKTNYHKFGSKFTIPSTKKKSYADVIVKDQIVYINVSNIRLECYVIEDYKDTLKYPHKPCIFKNVPGWYFIAFPELGQILPVSNIDSILDFRKDLKNTKIHFGLFKGNPLDSMASSDYAVMPYTKDTWNLFNKSNKNNWSKYLRQLSICQLSISNKLAQKIPVFTTDGLAELAKDIQPEDMATEWSLFTQLYFMLYLFKQVAKKEHFSF